MRTKNMIAQDDLTLLTVPEVCALLRIRPSTCYAAAAGGRLPHIVVWRGRRKSLLRFRRADIEALIRHGSSLQGLKG